MRISDWSSDVCSSDLAGRRGYCDRYCSRRRPGTGHREMLRVAAWNRAAKVRPANHGCLVRCHVTWWIRSRSSKSLGDRGAEAAWLNIRIRRGGKAAGAATKQAAGVADRSEEQTSELQSLMRISYDVFCLE